MFTHEICLPFKCPSRCLSSGEAVLNTGCLFPPQFVMTSQLALLRDGSRSLLVNIKAGLAPTIRAVRQGGLFWGSENDDTRLVYTSAERTERTVKPRPKAPPSLCLYNCSVGQTLKLSTSYDGIKCVEKYSECCYEEKQHLSGKKIECWSLEGFFSD